MFFFSEPIEKMRSSNAEESIFKEVIVIGKLFIFFIHTF